MSFLKAYTHKEKVQANACTSLSSWLSVFLTGCSPAEPVYASTQRGKFIRLSLYFKPVQFLGVLHHILNVGQQLNEKTDKDS